MLISNICEFYTATPSKELEPYNRCTGIEIRGDVCVPDWCKQDLEQYRNKLYENILYTEDKILIDKLDNITIREEYRNLYPVQMIVFIPISYLNRLHNSWIINSLDISFQSWYVIGLTETTRHSLFCVDECYHLTC